MAHLQTITHPYCPITQGYPSIRQGYWAGAISTVWVSWEGKGKKQVRYFGLLLLISSILTVSPPLLPNVGYTRFFDRVYPIVQSGAPSCSIGCTQLFNRVHSVAQSGALSWVIGRVRFFERLCQHYYFCKLFGRFKEILYLCHGSMVFPEYPQRGIPDSWGNL